MTQFYCYTRCSTCQKAKKYLEAQGIAFIEKPIKDHDLTKEAIQALHEKSKLPIRRLFNTSGMVYRELGLKDKLDGLPLDEAYELLASDGMLMKRPILITDQHVLFGFKEQAYQEVLSDVK